jgi:hypothetical protein
MILECTLLLDDVNNGAFEISVTADIALGATRSKSERERAADKFLQLLIESDDIFISPESG